MNRMKLTLGLILALTLILIPLTATAKDKHEIIESYKANALVQTRGAGTMAEIHIYRWSEDSERQEILEAIKANTAKDRPNTRAVAQSLRGQEKAGYAFMAGKQGYPLRCATLARSTWGTANGRSSWRPIDRSPSRRPTRAVWRVTSTSR